MVATIVLFAFSLLSLTIADGEANKKDKGFLKVTPRPTLRTRDLSKRCTGTCEECFGSGYTLCPGSNIYCYLPGDTSYGLDSCYATGSDPTSSAPASTSTGSAGDSDYCTGVGATCVSCFGSGYLDCPDGYHCYNPNDPMYDTCETSGDGSSSSSCADLYGTGSIDCGTDSCYNPTEGDVCCSDGSHCEDGDTCSTEVGYCCSPDSTSSRCGGGGLSSYSYSSYTYSYSSYSYSSYVPSTTDFFSDPTSTAGSAETGAAQFGGDASSADRSREVKIAGVVLGMFGLGMFLL